ncbi:hypothetical protein [Nostoc sp.]|uniref:hypothetical protein n=1 Tax=Nostoc sp. TaxID=1180 RepID=UPI002FF7B9BC
MCIIFPPSRRAVSLLVLHPNSTTSCGFPASLRRAGRCNAYPGFLTRFITFSLKHKASNTSYILLGKSVQFHLPLLNVLSEFV